MKQQILYIFTVFYLLMATNFVYGQAKDQTKLRFKKELLTLDSIAKSYFTSSDIFYLKESEILNLIDINFKELELLDSIDNDTLKMKFYERISHRFRMVELYEVANQISLKGIHTFNKNKNLAKHKSAIINFRNYGQIAGNYLALHKKDSALIYYKKGTDFADIYVNDKILRASAYNNMGMYLSEELKDYDEAIIYLNKAQQIMGTINGPVFTLFDGSIRDNLGNAYIGKKEYAKAKSLYKINFYFFNPKLFNDPHKDYYRWIRSGIQVAEMNIKLNELDLAKSRLDSIKNALNMAVDFTNKDKLKLRLLIAYKDLANLNNNTSQVEDYWNEVITLTDSIKEKKKKKSNWKTIMERYENNQLQKQSDRAFIKKELTTKVKIDEQESISLVIYILFFLVFLVVVTYIFVLKN